MILGEEKIYIRLLYELLIKGYIAKDDLRFLSDYNTSIYKPLARALSAKHITEGELPIRVFGRKRAIAYYSITNAGIRFLSQMQRHSQLLDWIADAETIPSSIRISGPNRITEKQLNTSAALLFLEDSIKEIPAIYVTGIDYKDDYTIKSFIEENNPTRSVFLRDETCSLKFYDGIYVKAQVKESTDNPEHNNGRYVGVLAGDKKTVLMYHTEREGMSWRAWVVETEKKALDNFIRTEGLAGHPYGESKAVILTDSPKEFGYTFWDKHGKRREGELIGDGFKECLIIPATKEGKENLLWYMNSEPKTEINSLVSDLIDLTGDDDEPIYDTNSDSYLPETFQLIRLSDRTLIHVGIFMDAIQLQRILRRLKQSFIELKAGRPTGFKYAVMCYEWQRPYYEAVLPEIEKIRI